MSITHLTRTVLHAEGLDCPGCAFPVVRALNLLGGVQRVELYFGTALIEIEHDDTQVDVDRLLHTIADEGLRASVRVSGSAAEVPRPTVHGVIVAGPKAA